jgi:hypothetical protein
MGASVTAVDAKAHRATIDRGKKAGVAVGDTGELFPLRIPDGEKIARVAVELRIARGKVVELNEDSALGSSFLEAGTPDVPRARGKKAGNRFNAE